MYVSRGFKFFVQMGNAKASLNAVGNNRVEKERLKM